MRKPLAERFWAKVQKTDTCWLWLSAKQRNTGYGTFHVGGRQGAALLAHRVSWELANGPIPAGLWVLHHCDVRACVRPAHLFLGTNSDNMADMWAKGRGVLPLRQPTLPEHARGSRHGVAKLTEEQVAEIRQRYGPATGRRQKGIPMPKHPVTQQQLADEYGVDQTIISDIVRRERWQHVS